jgi:hypothetical protein
MKSLMKSAGKKSIEAMTDFMESFGDFEIECVSARQGVRSYTVI